MNYFFYIILGVAPSLIWLVFYLRKDANPEPKTMVFKIFLGGALMGPIAVFLQMAIMGVFGKILNLPYFFAALSLANKSFFFNIFLIAPLTEEFLKYLVVKYRVLKNPSFDEPLDAMLYLIISALGFAAVENLLYILLAENLTMQLAVNQTVTRFLSAILLHTLSSGILGYFLAKSMINFKNRKKLFLQGFILAIAIHSAYNYLAWLLSSNSHTAAPLLAIFLLSLSGIVAWQFKRLKNQLSVCNI